MRTVLRPLIAVAALVALAVPSLASAASTAAVPIRHLPASGATIRWTVMVRNAKTCHWSSSPEVVGFDGTVKCKPGRVVRPAKFQANTSTGAKDYTLNLVMRGTTRTVVHLKVVEAGTPAPTTTTSTTTTSTTTTTLPPTSFPGSTSSNWSGYVLTGRSGGYEAISAYWTMPTVDCASAVPDSATSDWVGVNESPGLFQDGTTSQCVSGQQIDYAWWTDEAENFYSPSLFAVAAGDDIDAEVWQETSGLWAYYVSDLTSGSSSSATEPFSGLGTTAEWIAEDTGDPSTNEPYPLADFGSVTFTDLGLTVPSGSWMVPPYSDAWEMVAPDGSVEALPSPIQGSGASAAFTVTYETPGAMSSTAGTAAVKHGQSTFVAPVPRIAPQHQAPQLGGRSIPAPKLGLVRIK
jgi:hypothetical protein